MSQNSATEGALGDLHNTLALVLTNALKAEGGAPAAVLAVAAKFLKDNDITCVVDKNNQMGALNEALENATAPPEAVSDAVLNDALAQVVSMEQYRNGTH